MNDIIFTVFKKAKTLLANQILLQRVVFVLLLVFYGILVAYKLELPVALDLPRQMMNGQEILQGDFRSITQNLYSYTQTDHYFANHHWLYGVFAYLLYLAVGWGGMVIFKILFILLTFYILFKAALMRANFWVVAMASIPTILLLTGRSDLRPELFGNFFIAIYVYILLQTDKHKENLIFWLIPMQILWANLHITWPIGPMLVGGFLIEKIILGAPVNFKQKFSWQGIKALSRNALIQKLILLIAILVLVSFLNPLGINGVLYSLDRNIGANADGPLVSSEVQSPSSQIDGLPIGTSFTFRIVKPLIVLLGISFIFGYRSKNIFYLLGSIGTGIMALSVIRGAPFLAMFFLLAFPANITSLFLFLKQWILKKFTKIKIDIEVVAGWLLIGWLVFYFLSNSSTLLRGQNAGIGLAKDAESSAHFFIDNNLKGPIFNDSDIGSYLIWYLYPNERVFSDNRFGDAYSNQFFQENYVDAITDETKWEKVLEKYKLNVIFLYQYDNGYNLRDFIARRIGDPKWVWVYGDRYNVILVRNIPENQAVIDKYAITVENIRDRFGNLLGSLNSEDQVAVADLFALGGYPNWARSSYAIALSQNPKWAKIWWAMGEMELLRGTSRGGDPGLGALFIEQAIKYGWATPNSYSYLALAYYQMGFLDAAEKAVRMELKINPKSEDGKRWLDLLAKARLEARDKAEAEKIKARIDIDVEDINKKKEAPLQ